MGIKLGPRNGLDNYLEAPVKVSLLNDSVNIRIKKYFTNSKSPSSYVITHQDMTIFINYKILMNLPELILLGFIPLYLFRKLIKILKKLKENQVKYKATS